MCDLGVKWEVFEEKRGDFHFNVEFSKRKCMIFGLNGAFSSGKRVIFEFNLGFLKGKWVIFGLNGRFSKRKRVISA